MRYIRSFFDNTKSIIKISGCQHCPLMKFKVKDSVCVCRSFRDTNNSNIIEPWVLNHTDRGIILEDIKIPKWCELPKKLEDLKEYKRTYRAFTSSVLMEENDTCNDNDLPFIDIDKESSKNPEKIYDYLMTLVDKSSIVGSYPNRFNHFGSINDTDYYDDEYYGRNYETENFNLISKSKYEVCSCCGEEDKSVKRNSNYGMCDGCWEIYKNDDFKKRQSFIHNFRMKRNNNFDYNKVFKIINEINLVDNE